MVATRRLSPDQWPPSMSASLPASGILVSAARSMATLGTVGEVVWPHAANEQTKPQTSEAHTTATCFMCARHCWAKAHERLLLCESEAFASPNAGWGVDLDRSE